VGAPRLQSRSRVYCHTSAGLALGPLVSIVCQTGREADISSAQVLHTRVSNVIAMLAASVNRSARLRSANLRAVPLPAPKNIAEIGDFGDSTVSIPAHGSVAALVARSCSMTVRRAACAAALTLLLSACQGYRASSVHVADPGAHVVSGRLGHSVVWSDGKTQRVCSFGTASHSDSSLSDSHFQKGPGKKQGHFKHHGRSLSALDAALFRLCEARGNGDLTAEQYHEALMMLLARPGPPHILPPRWGPKPKRGRPFRDGGQAPGSEVPAPPPPANGEGKPTSSLLHEMLHRRE
jgi:hypothetical protein